MSKKELEAVPDELPPDIVQEILQLNQEYEESRAASPPPGYWGYMDFIKTTGCSKDSGYRTVRKMYRAGLLHRIKVGHRYYFKRKTDEELAQEQEN